LHIFEGKNVEEHSTKFTVRKPTQKWRHETRSMWWWLVVYCHPIGCYIEVCTQVFLVSSSSV